MRFKAVAFDWGHTIMNEQMYRDIPVNIMPIELMPGVIETLSKIPLLMHIWANTSVATKVEIETWLLRASLDQYFEQVITSVDAGYKKPDRQFFDYALDKCGLKKEEIILVGNQLNTDIKGANNYGITNVWIDNSFFKSLDDDGDRKKIQPTYTIKKFVELPLLLDGLGKRGGGTLKK